MTFPIYSSFCLLYGRNDNQCPLSDVSGMKERLGIFGLLSKCILPVKFLRSLFKNHTYLKEYVDLHIPAAVYKSLTAKYVYFLWGCIIEIVAVSIGNLLISGVMRLIICLPVSGWMTSQ